MNLKDIAFIDALFDELSTYSPILICTKTLEAEEYVQKKLNSHGIHTVTSESAEGEKTDGVIALIDVEKVEENSNAQDWLSDLLDRCRESEQLIILTSHKKINEMQIMGKLKSRLLSGIYTEL